MQYRFREVSPAETCTSIALLAHLARSGNAWRISSRREPQTTKHRGMQAIELIDPTGDGP